MKCVLENTAGNASAATAAGNASRPAAGNAPEPAAAAEAAFKPGKALNATPAATAAAARPAGVLPAAGAPFTSRFVSNSSSSLPLLLPMTRADTSPAPSSNPTYLGEPVQQHDTECPVHRVVAPRSLSGRLMQLLSGAGAGAGAPRRCKHLTPVALVYLTLGCDVGLLQGRAACRGSRAENMPAPRVMLSRLQAP